MIREVRVVTLAILVLIAYSAFIFVDQGTFIFPFPLNEIIFAIVSFQFFLWNRKISPVLSWLFLSVSLIGLLTSQVFWTFFLEVHGLEHFYEGIYPDVIILAYYILLGITAFYFFNSSQEKYSTLYGIVCLAPLLACLVTGNRFYELLFSVIVAIISAVLKLNHPFNYLWILLATLNAMKAIMLLI